LIREIQRAIREGIMNLRHGSWKTT
jgi:hypothetical protein